MENLSNKQLAHRLILAARRGENPFAYMTRVGWPYVTVRQSLVNSGDWTRVMAAKYEQSER
jgi:hypothetical protein